MGLGQQVAFSSLFAFLPTVILLIGLLGLFGTGAFDSLEHFVGSVAPHGVLALISAPIAPVAAHTARNSPPTKAIAEPPSFWAASCLARSIMSSTPCGATEPTKCSSESKAPVPNSPSRPIEQDDGRQEREQRAEGDLLARGPYSRRP